MPPMVMEKAGFYALLEAGEGAITHRQTGESISLSRQDFADLCELTVANWLEQRPRVKPEYKRIREDEFRRMLPILSPHSRTALAEAYGFPLD